MEESNLSMENEGETTDIDMFLKRLVSCKSLSDARAAFSDILVEVVQDSSKVSVYVTR